MSRCSRVDSDVKQETKVNPEEMHKKEEKVRGILEVREDMDIVMEKRKEKEATISILDIGLSMRQLGIKVGIKQQREIVKQYVIYWVCHSNIPCNAISNTPFIATFQAISQYVTNYKPMSYEITAFTEKEY